MIRFQLILLSLLVVSCSKKEIKFNKTGWNKGADHVYEYRELMVNDLAQNHLRKGMCYQELVDLLGKPGQPYFKKGFQLSYQIMEDYGWDIDPVETKTLIFDMTSDSLVKDFRIEHWKK